MIAGITGHQDLGDARAWVRRVIAEEVDRRRVTRGLTSLAAGADQLFAEVLLEIGIPYETVVPCAGYEQTFADTAVRNQFERLLATSARVEQLPYDSPSEECFLAAGQRIVIECELLLAVWNGEPARGLGGTGDIVAFARSRRRSWIHIDPEERAVRIGL